MRFIFYLILSFLMSITTASALSTAEEYEIKAAYLFNLGNFVRWNDNVLQESIDICILGQDPFGVNIDLIAKKQRTIQDRPINIKRLTQVSVAQSCAILFIGDSEQSQFPTIFESLKGKPILTVGDSDKFIVSGGMVQFYQREGKIRLMIDPQTLEENQLKVSSHLMRIAHRIER
jgi:hypothetical protein